MSATSVDNTLIKSMIDTTPYEKEIIMYIFVNNDLGMGKGKIAGQVGHVVGVIVGDIIKSAYEDRTDEAIADYYYYKKWITNNAYKKVVLTRKNILRRDSYKCAYCGRADITLTVDHVFPRARGGDESWENLITACTICNNRKGDRTPEEANMKLLFKPFKPSHILFIKNVVARLDERWKPYLYLS